MCDLFSEVETVGLHNHNDEYKISGLKYLPAFITEQEHDSLLSSIDNQQWLDDLKRRVQHYGYKYDYKQHNINHDMKIADLPDWLENFAVRLKEKGIFKKVPDQVIVNEYLPGQGITNHIDCPPCFSDTITSLSLGSDCVMNLTEKDDNSNVIPYLLNKKSLIILKEEARYEWMHGIKMVKNDHYYGLKIPRKRRVSLTFRSVII